MPYIIFMCVGNSCRSQMAEGFMKNLAPKEWIINSAGTKPSNAVNPLAIEVMKEVGIDISKHTTKVAPIEMISQASHIISMGCGVLDSCPVYLFSNKVVEDWDLEDPAGQSIEKFREVRDKIKQRIKIFIEKLKRD